MPFEYKIDKKAAQAFSDYANGKQAPMTFINSFDGPKQCILKKVMTPLSAIIKNDYGYSIYVCLDPNTAEELNNYDSLGQRLVPNGIEYKNLLINGEKLYLKLKVVDEHFPALPLVTTLDYESFNLANTNLEVTFNLGVWVNFEKRSAGTFLKVTSINKV